MEQQKLSPNLGGLPEDLLLLILSRLPMIEVVRISFSCERWKNLWKSVPIIDFSQTSITETPELIAAVDIVLSNREAFKIREFRVHVEWDLCPMDKVRSWIDSVMRHEVEVLYLDLTTHHLVGYLPMIPLPLFQSKSLTALTLKYCLIDVPPIFCMVSLKTLHFVTVDFDDDELTILLNNCPVLKDLTLEKCNIKRDLKIIAMDSHLENLNIYEEDNCDSGQIVFEISAPNLVTLNFFGTPRRTKYIRKNLNSLVSVNFDFICPPEIDWFAIKMVQFWEIFQEFCHAKVIKLSCWCTTILSIGELRNFAAQRSDTVTDLVSDTVTDLVFTTPCWKFNLRGLVYVLKKFVNLEVLTINIMDGYNNELCHFSYQYPFANDYWRPDDPSVFGLQKHLRIVKINGFLDSMDLKYFPRCLSPYDILDGRNTEFEFVMFLRKNLTELETMVVTPSRDLKTFPAKKRDDIIFLLSLRLLDFHPSSPNAQVVICHDHLTGIREKGR